MGKIMRNGNKYSCASPNNAQSVVYDNTTSGLEAENTKEAIDELSSKIDEQNKNKLKIKYVSIATEPIAGSIDYAININTLKAEVSDMKEYKGFIPFSIAPVTTWQTYAVFLNQTYDNIIIHTIGTSEQQYQIYGYIVYI